MQIAEVEEEEGEGLACFSKQNILFELSATNVGASVCVLNSLTDK